MYNLLIIDGDEKLRAELEEWLVADGYGVRTAADGVSAMNQFLERLPDLIISDMELPGLSGSEFLQKIRDLTDGLPPVFIFLTAKSGISYFRKGMSFGADDCLLKPLSRADLLNAVSMRLSLRKGLIQGITFNAANPSGSSVQLNISEVNSMLKKLSKTEMKIFRYVAEEKSTAEIAGLLYVSPKTVENHRHSISRKLKLKGGYSVLTMALKLKPVLSALDDL